MRFLGLRARADLGKEHLCEPHIQLAVCYGAMREQDLQPVLHLHIAPSYYTDMPPGLRVRGTLLK